MTGLGRASPWHTSLSGRPNRQPGGAGDEGDAGGQSSWGLEPRQKAQFIMERFLRRGFWASSGVRGEKEGNDWEGNA